MEKKGLIEKIVSTPARYELPLPEVLAILIERRETESRELQEKTTILLHEYEDFTNEQHVDGCQFVLVPSGKAFSNRLQKLIINSKKIICVITDQKTLTQFFDFIKEIFDSIMKKEVNIRIITQKSKNNTLTKRAYSLQQKAHLEIRFVDILPSFALVTFDEKEILLSTQTQNRNDSFVVYSNNLSLVELSQRHFNDLWFSAVEPPGLTFKRTKLQFDYLCANMLNGFAYCRMIFKNGKPTDFVYLQINEAFERITGLNRGQVIGKGALKVIPGIEGANPELFEIYGRVSCSGKAEELETFVKPLNLWLHLSIYSPKKGYFAVIFENITERKKSEAEREIMINFLKITNSTNNTSDLIRATTDFFQKQSDCQAVGIRLKEDDDFPYYETRGFPPEHVELENKLCRKDDSGFIIRDFKGDPIIECMCGNVICGRFDPAKKFFTKKGSFWANDTTRLLATTTDKDRQTKTRNRCNGEGYESVALIALRVGNHRLGLLQLNDKRKNMFTLEKIEMWERIADNLALGLSKTIAEESLCKHEQNDT